MRISDWSSDVCSSDRLDPRLPPEAQALARLEARQEAFPAHLLAAVNMRAAKARDAVATPGLDPKMLVRKASVGQGSPFITWPGRIGRAGALGKSFAQTAGAMSPMELLAPTQDAHPTGAPPQEL